MLSLVVVGSILLWGGITAPALAVTTPSPAVSGSWNIDPIGPGQVSDMDSGRVVLVKTSPGGSEAGSSLLVYDIASTETLSYNTPYFVTQVDLKGDHAAFIANEGQSSSLRLLTLSSGEIERVADLGQVWSEGKDFVIAGGQLLWIERDTSGATGVWTYDLASKETRVLADGETYGSPAELIASENWLVFHAQKTGESQTYIWAFNLETGSARECPRTFGYAEEVEGGSLYYVPSNPHAFGALPELHRFDLATGIDEVVTSGSEYQNLQADGDRLAWASWANGRASVVVRDLTTGSETQIPVPAYWIGGLRLDGDVLLWGGQARIGYSVSKQGNYLFACDLANGTVTRLSPNFRYPQRWYTDGQSVAYLKTIWQTQTAGYVVATRIVPSPTTFTDVSGFDPYFTAIAGLKLLGAAEGYPTSDGKADFRPEGLLTRAQFAKMLAEVLDLDVTEGLVSSFVDLGENDPQSLFPHEYVAAVVDLGGIINGTSPDHFSPYANLTRAQLVTFIARAARVVLPGVLEAAPTLMEPTLGLFDPVHGPQLELAERGGLLDGLVGYGPAWDPWRAATRAEAAQVLWNLAEMAGLN